MQETTLPPIPALSPWRHVVYGQGEAVGYGACREHGARKEVFRLSISEACYRRVVRRIDRSGGALQAKACALFDALSDLAR